jgi:hypothetical protein
VLSCPAIHRRKRRRRKILPTRKREGEFQMCPWETWI